MASSREQLDFVVDQMSGAGAIEAKRMFGEYGIYCDGTLVALFCDDRLFVKPTAAGRGLAPAVREAPAYPGAKPSLLIEEGLENREWLSALIRATAGALAGSARPRRAAGGVGGRGQRRRG
jgi:TfoX/Sxy family transcriptional regulator of competence genes